MINSFSLNGREHQPDCECGNPCVPQKSCTGRVLDPFKPINGWSVDSEPGIVHEADCPGH